MYQSIQDCLPLKDFTIKGGSWPFTRHVPLLISWRRVDSPFYGRTIVRFSRDPYQVGELGCKGFSANIDGRGWLLEPFYYLYFLGLVACFLFVIACKGYSSLLFSDQRIGSFNGSVTKHDRCMVKATIKEIWYRGPRSFILKVGEYRYVSLKIRWRAFCFFKRSIYSLDFRHCILILGDGWYTSFQRGDSIGIVHGYQRVGDLFVSMLQIIGFRFGTTNDD